jgi:acyl carrier protein
MVTTLVRTSTATVLAHPDPAALDTELAFKDLGIDSLTTLELRNALSAHTGLTMPASVVFDHPTPAAFAKYLTGQLTDTAAVVLGPIGQLVEAALDNEDRTVLVEILIATSGLQSADLDDGASPKDITATDVTVLDDAPVRLVCLAEFAGQYQAFAAGIQGDVQVTEVLAPGFSGTSPPATVENAAQAIVDALDARILGSQTLVIAGHGVTCVPALHVVQLLRGQISSTGAQLPRLATVLIGPIATRDARTISADPLLPQAISAHLHSEGDLIAYGRYLRFGMHSPEATQDEGLLAIHPRIGKHVKVPASPLVLEPALTALSISNWIDDLQ